MSSLVYMLYLALESGRLATKRLVEFEPTRTEGIMVTLLSELTAYQHLRTYLRRPASRRRACGGLARAVGKARKQRVVLPPPAT
jgi:hypothetical protein